MCLLGDERRDFMKALFEIEWSDEMEPDCINEHKLSLYMTSPSQIEGVVFRLVVRQVSADEILQQAITRDKDGIYMAGFAAGHSVASSVMLNVAKALKNRDFSEQRRD